MLELENSEATFEKGSSLGSLQWDAHESGPAVAEPMPAVVRVVWLVAGVLVTILAIRLLLTIVGANPATAVAHVFYNLSYPLVAPFFQLFSYAYRYGVPTFESSTLIAIVVYSFIAWTVAKLFTTSYLKS